MFFSSLITISQNKDMFHLLSAEMQHAYTGAYCTRMLVIKHN